MLREADPLRRGTTGRHRSRQAISEQAAALAHRARRPTRGWSYRCERHGATITRQTLRELGAGATSTTPRGTIGLRRASRGASCTFRRAQLARSRVERCACRARRPPRGNVTVRAQGRHAGIADPRRTASPSARSCANARASHEPRTRSCVNRPRSTALGTSASAQTRPVLEVRAGAITRRDAGHSPSGTPTVPECQHYAATCDRKPASPPTAPVRRQLAVGGELTVPVARSPWRLA